MEKETLRDKIRGSLVGGAIGDALGAIVGYDAIPEKFKRGLQLNKLIVSVADNLGGANQ